MTKQHDSSILTRRDFLRGAAAGVGTLVLPNAAHADDLRFQPATFDITSDGAIVWIAGGAAEEVAVELGSDDKLSAPRRAGTVSLARASDYVAAINVTGLEPDRTWYYRVVNAKTGASMSSIGRFRTAPLAPRPFSFAWSGDMNELLRPFRLFDVIAKRDPEFFLHLGDTVYADQPRNQFNPSIAHYRRKHANNRRDSHLQQFMLRYSTYAIWDDHETDSDCHGGHPNMGEGMQVFREYWPCRSHNQEGLYRKFSWAGVDFIILDTRRFRSPQQAPDDPSKTMLGTTQKEWLLDTLGAAKAPFTFIITSVPFQGGGEDTWGSYRTERNEISAFIRQRKVGGVVFLAADYHLARDWTNPKAGFREFMAGPIAATTFYRMQPDARARYEKAGMFHYGDGYNFGMFQVDPAAAKATLEFVGIEGNTLHKQEFGA